MRAVCWLMTQRSNSTDVQRWGCLPMSIVRPDPGPTVTVGSGSCDVQQQETSGGPRRIRTPDPLIRSQVLYPAELSVRDGEAVFRPEATGVQADSSKKLQKVISPRGSLISKVVPSGPVVFRNNSPPWPRTNSCEIANPKPEPPLRTPP